VKFLEAQEVGKLWVGSLDLAARGPAMVGEIKRSTEVQCEIDQAPESDGGLGDPRFVMLGMEVKNQTGEVLTHPCEEAFRIAQDKPDSAVREFEETAEPFGPFNSNSRWL
jgi:hypothetical protein